MTDVWRMIVDECTAIGQRAEALAAGGPDGEHKAAKVKQIAESAERITAWLGHLPDALVKPARRRYPQVWTTSVVIDGQHLLSAFGGEHVCSQPTRIVRHQVGSVDTLDVEVRPGDEWLILVDGLDWPVTEDDRRSFVDWLEVEGRP